MAEDSLLEFPCDFPIKIMGRDSPEFRSLARGLVEQHAGALPDSALQAAVSRSGRFVSITATITATSQKQLDDIYYALTAHQDVLMAL
jgi:putative lipoic acid-binding regulatory protein